MMRLPGFLRRDDARLFLGKLREQKIHEGARFRPTRCSPVRQPQQKYQSLQHIGFPQAGVARVLLLGLAVFLDHGLNLRGDPALRFAGQRLLVVQAGVDAALIGGRQDRERRDQIAIIQTRDPRAQPWPARRSPHQQMFLLVHELVGNLDVEK